MESSSTLRLIVDTGDARPASDDLDRLSEAAHRAEDSFDSLADKADAVKKTLSEPIRSDSIEQVESSAEDSEQSLVKLRETAADLRARLSEIGDDVDLGDVMQSVGAVGVTFEELREDLALFKSDLENVGTSAQLPNIEESAEKLQIRFQQIADQARVLDQTLGTESNSDPYDYVISSAERASEAVEFLQQDLSKISDRLSAGETVDTSLFDLLDESVNRVKQNIGGLQQDADSLSFDQAGQEVGQLESGFSKLGKSIGGVILGIADFAAKALTIGSGLAIYQATAQGDEAEKNFASLRQGLETTGNQIGRTFEEITALTETLSFDSLFSDEDLNNVASRLITFEKITGKVFERAIKISADFAAKTKSNAETAALQLGRALEGSSGSFELLRRAGVTFTQAERERLQTLLAENKLYEYQVAILDKLERKVGGTASAVAAAGDQGRIAAKQFNEVIETLGREEVNATSEAFRELASTLADPKTVDAFRDVGRALGEGIAFAVEQIDGLLSLLARMDNRKSVERTLKDTGVFSKKGVFGEERKSTGGLRTRDFTEEQVIQLSVELDEEDIRRIRDRVKNLKTELEKGDKGTYRFESGAALARQEIENLEAVANKADWQRFQDGLSGISSGFEEVAVNAEEAAVSLDAFDTKLGRKVSQFERLAQAAGTGGEDALQQIEREIQIEEELYQLREQAKNAGQAFDEASARAALERIKYLEEEIDLRLEIEELLNRQREDELERTTVAPAMFRIGEFNREVSRQSRRGNLDNKSTVQNLIGQKDELRKWLDEFLYGKFDPKTGALVGEGRGKNLSKEQIDKLYAALNDAGINFNMEVGEAADYLRDSIEASVDGFVSNIVDAIFLNQGKGLGAAFESISRSIAGDTFLDPVKDWLKGDGTLKDLWNNIKGEEFGGTDSASVKRFKELGNVFDDLLGSGDTLSGIFGTLGKGLAGGQIGGSIAGLINGGRGGTGSTIGGLAGSFLPIPGGDIIGGIVGGLLGGLFGRKSSKGSIDFDTGETFAAKGTGGAKDERRDKVLQETFSTLQRIADLIGADIDVGTGLKVVAGKKSITTQIIEADTGQPIGGQIKVGKKDVSGAIDETLDAALNAIIKGGDERIRRVADALLGKGLPTTKIVSGLEIVANAFESTGPARSEFIDGLEQLVDVFEDATALAGRYGEATSDLVEVQIEAIEAIAQAFDKSISDRTRQIKDPIAQDAIELARRQEVVFREAASLNDALAKAAESLLSASSTPTFQGQSWQQQNVSWSREINDAFNQGAYELLQQNSLATTEALNELGATQDDLAASAGELTDAQKRNNAVMELAVAEWEQFVEQAANSPEAFQAAAKALQQLRLESESFPLSQDQIDKMLENVRASFATTFDKEQERRLLEFTDPTQARLIEILEEQTKALDAARAISTPEDLEKRLDLVASVNTEQLREFFETSGDTAEILQAAASALEKYADQIGASGVNTDILRMQIENSRKAIAEGADEETIDRMLKLVSSPTAELRNLIKDQSKKVQFAQSVGANVDLVQRTNFLELEKFLDGLSDADLASIGDVFKIISDEAGRLPVVLLELDDAFERFVDNREQEADRLKDLGEQGARLTERATKLDLDIRRRFGGLFPKEEFETLFAQVVEQRNLAANDTKSTEDRLSASERGLDLASELIEVIAKTFGGSAEGATQRDILLELINEFKTIDKGLSDQSFSLAEAMEREHDVLIEIRDKIESPDPKAVEYISDILKTGQINNELVSGLLTEFVNLSRAADAQREELRESIREAAIEGFSGEVSVVGMVKIDDNRLATIMSQVLDVLNTIEENQSRGATEQRLGIG